MLFRLSLVGVASACLLSSVAIAQNSMTYQKPPEPIEALLDAPASPIARLSPDRRMLLVVQPATFPTIADVAQPRFRLAGLRSVRPASDATGSDQGAGCPSPARGAGIRRGRRGPAHPMT